MHRRADSSSKWKQVLGFDDGSTPVTRSIPTPSPPYSKEDLESEIAPPISPPRTRRPVDFPRLPRDLTFTRTGRNDIFISPSSPAPSPNDLKPLPDPPPLFYLTSQEDPTSESTFSLPKPDLIFHSGPNRTSSIICFSNFHSANLNIDITLCPLAPPPTSPDKVSSFIPPPASNHYEKPVNSGPKFTTERLTSSGGIFTAEKYAFHLKLPRTSVREKFEWRQSSGPFVRTMDGVRESGGLKLVRCITGDTVAVYAGLGHSSRTRNPKRVVGMFRFLGERLGEEFDVYAVISMLSIVERGRRAVEANRIAYGVS